MNNTQQVISNVFTDRLKSWRKEYDPGLLNDYFVINLNAEPTIQDKELLIRYFRGLYPKMFFVENHHTKESDFQLRIYSH